ncbi:hypothetical protein [Streptomyces shenzhenensis]|uniref:hypothetical protein n=1 Tax=Streptomyces shenzhenensis TaxID=943815 RepID=UPI0036A64963
MTADHEYEEEDSRESTESLIADWEAHVAHLRRTGDKVRWLHAELTPWHGVRDRSHEWDWIMREFSEAASGAHKRDFESLIFQTMELHNRGTGVLNPDHGPNPVPSPFVRHMPADQAEIEAKRIQRQGRHVVTYQEHIRQCLDHFVLAWTALIDGCSICDWDMIDDEFPKLALLAEEAKRAHDIWSSFDR